MPLDPVSRLVLDEAGSLPTRVLVVDDPDLANHLVDVGHDVLASCDDQRDQQRLSEGVREWGGAYAEVVLARLGKAIASLDELAAELAQRANGGPLHLVAGGRDKHLTPAMNLTLGRSFTDVHASRGRQKSRVLHASGPRRDAEQRWPKHAYVDDVGLTVVAHGGVFAGPRLDPGTRLLLRTLPSPTAALDAIDLACGSGLIAAVLARAGHRVTAVDVSAAAIASTRATLAANGLSATVVRSDGLIALADAAADLIVCNPPFHLGASKDSTPAMGMLADAGRVLRAGGELWCVYNAHLPYLPTLRAAVGPTLVAARNRDFIVTRTRNAPGERLRAKPPGAVVPKLVR